ncbi:hypothetical protein THASP1DRAFT_32906 [Thamnocephalis sphaerospora]|uniref:Uncharacterized protein n=1 Tax=Thamnocephalis sphaerospora TaxID=78915 RepID=A0A4P9XHZ7_9FUNG|nr:hypothetical protein THASP1DRAFT_32906 [Thamnocephalis sphaerospora]|eukprot:RKP05256.1 hypothetical protein THASP1DRAFT_32906 [Thamnocephalis sphaerospora]
MSPLDTSAAAQASASLLQRRSDDGPFDQPLQLLLRSESPSKNDPEFPYVCYWPDQPLALASFHPHTYVVFATTVVLAGYALYSAWIRWAKWEYKKKTAADHYTDVMQALCYTLVVFTFGGYSHTFGWPMLLAYYAGLWLYGLLVEVPFLRISLPSWRTWSRPAWAVMITAFLLICGLAAYHIVLAAHLGILWPWYLGLFLVAWAVLLLGIGLAMVDRRWWAKRRVQRLRMRLERTANASVDRSVANGEENAPASRGLDDHAAHVHTGEPGRRYLTDEPCEASLVASLPADDSLGGAVSSHRRSTSRDMGPSAEPQPPSHQQVLSSSVNAPMPPKDAAGTTVSQRRSRHAASGPGTTAVTAVTATATPSHLVDTRAEVEPRTASLESLSSSGADERDAVLTSQDLGEIAEKLLAGLRVHVHHWQIFFILAFFTRFQDVVSQISAGLVLACFMQGGIAYGFDSMLEPEWTTFTL